DFPSLEAVEDVYEGEWCSWREYADHMLEESGLLEGVSDEVRRYIDYDQWARDLLMDYTVEDAEDGGVSVFRTLRAIGAFTALSRKRANSMSDRFLPPIGAHHATPPDHRHHARHRRHRPAHRLQRQHPRGHLPRRQGGALDVDPRRGRHLRPPGADQPAGRDRRRLLLEPQRRRADLRRPDELQRLRHGQRRRLDHHPAPEPRHLEAATEAGELSAITRPPGSIRSSGVLFLDLRECDGQG